MGQARNQIMIIFSIYFIIIGILFIIRKRIAFDVFIYSILPFCMSAIGLVKSSEGKRFSDSSDSLTKKAQKTVELLKWGGIIIFIIACVLRYYCDD